MKVTFAELNINTRGNTGMLLYAALWKLSTTNFKEGSEYEPFIGSKSVLESLTSLAGYIHYGYHESPFVSDYIDVDCIEGKILLTAIEVLSSTNECSKSYYGSNTPIEDILERLVEITKRNNRNRSIDLII